MDTFQHGFTHSMRMRLHLFVCIFAVLVSAAHASGQVIWFVDDDNCPGPGDGSFGNPFCSIQDAIDAALDGDDIVVMPGSYFEDVNYSGKGVHIYSASGDPADTIIDVDIFGIRFINGEGSSSVLDGFTITGGTSGCMSISGATPQIWNCVLAGNSSTNGGCVWIGGVGANPKFLDCVFENNSADDGGAVDIVGGNATFTDCTFRHNTATFRGGALEIEVNADIVTLYRCAFYANTANEGGAVSVFSQGLTRIYNCSFVGNESLSATVGGSAIRLASHDPEIINCTFHANASAAPAGGAIELVTGSPIATITNSIIRNNTPEQITVNSGSALMTYSNVQGGFAGTGNVDADPRFIDPDGADDVLGTEDDDLNLDRHSPCTDAGDNDALPSWAVTDLDENPRYYDDAGVADTGSPGTGGPPIIDMGAYERQVDTLPIITLNPGDSIQEAIDLFQVGLDTEIVLNPGTYFESIDFNGKPITIRSTDPTNPAVVAATIIDGGGAGRVVLCISGEAPDSMLYGVTVTGGGMRVHNSSPTIRKCVFTANQFSSGGAISFWNSASTVVECEFTNNTAPFEGGALHISASSAVDLISCTFAGNGAGSHGGAVYIWQNSGVSVDMIDCRFISNSAQFGGAASVPKDAINASNCVFNGNHASRYGGAIDGIGSGIVIPSDAGVIYLSHCTIVNNVADIGAGGIYASDIVEIANSIVRDNSPNQFTFNYSQQTVSYSNVQGGLSGVQGSENIDANPLFVDPEGPDNIPGTEDDDLRLSPISPCIDAGSAALLPADVHDLDGDGDTAEPLPLDIDGNARSIDGNLDGFAVPDMGAYEFNTTFDSIVFNQTQSTVHDTFDTAIAVAADSDTLVASPGTFVNQPDIDFNNKDITLKSSADIAQPADGLYELTDGARLETSTANTITIAGELRADMNASVDVRTGLLTIDPTGEIVCRPGSTLSIDGATANNGTMIVLDSTLFAEDLSMAGTTHLTSEALVFADHVTVDPGGRLNMAGEIYSNITNDEDAYCLADTLVVGDYTNNGTTTVQIGTLTIVGSLTNNGTIIGDVQSSRGGAAGTQPGDGLSIAGDYVAGPTSSLHMPDPVWRLTVGGDYDVAINDHNRYFMSEAELELNGGAAQQLERMSVDIGDDPAGLDRALPGHFPIGTLRVSSGAVVSIVDAHDNDGLGQSSCEAVYVRNLIVGAAAQLNTNGCPVYYDTIVLNGVVDDPLNLIPIDHAPPCAADIAEGDDVVNVFDLLELLAHWGTNGTGADIAEPNDVVDVFDLLGLLSAWGACN